MEQNKAIAAISGGKKYKDIYGRVFFTQTADGVIVTAQIYNLPNQNSQTNGVFGFHIHEGSDCSGTAEDEFSNALGHYNPQNMPHPYHAGDLPPLFSNNGYAFMQVLTNRFRLNDVIDHVVIIHSMPDDFKTQPSGNSGTKIACGKILRTNF